jgi:hypothetical protein
LAPSDGTLVWVYIVTSVELIIYGVALMNIFRKEKNRHFFGYHSIQKKREVPFRNTKIYNYLLANSIL